MLGRKLPVNVVDGVDIKVRKGGNLAIVGESGCGKTTIGKMLAGLLRPNSGKILIEGKDISLLDRKEIARIVQPIFQDPVSALNPQKTVEQILSKPLRLHGIKFTTSDIVNLLEQVKLTPGSMFLKRYPHQLSGGQKRRVLIARALALRPKVIIADEPFAGLDATVQAQIVSLLKEIQLANDVTYVIISHDVHVVNQLCSDVVVVYLGKVVEFGSINKVLGNPLHPYTISLLNSYPSDDPARREWVDNPPVLGEIPSITNIPRGCRFNPRCRYALESCKDYEPSLTEVEEDHYVACPVYVSHISRSAS